MSELTIFKNDEFGEVRTVTINGQPYFVGKDVAEILGYANTRKSILDHVDEEDKTDGVTIRDSIGREQNAVCINESGLYSLILSSKLPNAKKFKRWVTSEVLPSIRTSGSYVAGQENIRLQMSPQLQMLQGLLDQMARQEMLVQQANENANKAIICLDNIKEAVMPVFDNWRGEMNAKFNRIQKNADKQFNVLRTEIYFELERRACCDLDARMRNRRTKMKENGCTKTAIDRFNKMDIIEADNRLREIFAKIVTEYEIKYCA